MGEQGSGVGDRGDRAGQRVLVVAPNWLGDAVMALPAIADVRRRFAGATLVIAARRSVAGVFPLVPGIDEVVTLEKADAAARLRTARPDVAILLPNSFSSAWLARSAGVPERWGYASDFRRPLLSRAVRRPRGSMHQAQYYQHLVSQLGAENGPLTPSVVVPERATDAARVLLTRARWDGSRPLVVMAPGAAYGTAKRWLPSHVSTLATRLVRERGMQVAMVGAGADRETTAQIAAALPGDVAEVTSDLAGETTLDTLAGVLRLSSVCVSNDSGTMHFAAAIGVPVVALFGPTREHETRPLPGPGGRARVLINPVWCRPCMLRECPIDHRCMKGLRPDVVVEAVQEMVR